MKFSFCALCRNKETLKRIKNEAQKIFPIETEYLLIDNSKIRTDCYNAIREFLKNDKSDLIIISHDDITFKGLNYNKLLNNINDIIKYDNDAILFGVAGCNRDQKGVGHFCDGNIEHFWGFPDRGKVTSLDEVFLIVRKNQGLNVSDSLSGFHFYGTDLCINAEKLGKSSYAIDFPITHASEGKIDSTFFKARDEFENHLKNNQNKGIVRTTCTYLYGGNSVYKKCESLIKSWKILCGHPFERIARDCINQRGYKHIGPCWLIIKKHLEYKELIRKYRKKAKRFILQNQQK
jgi:hypothetical protein